MVPFNLDKHPFLLDILNLRSISGDLKKKKNSSIDDEKNFWKFLFIGIFIKKNMLDFPNSDKIEKKTEEKDKKKIISFLCCKLFSHPENTQKFFSFLIFGIKLGFFSQISKILSRLLPRNLSLVNFWKICILSDWQFSRSFKISDSFIKQGLSLNDNSWILLKEYFRLKVFFFKFISPGPKISYGNEKTIPPQWFEIIATIFTSFLTICPFGFLLSGIIMIYTKEIWWFPELGFYFKQLLGLVKSKCPRTPDLIRVLNVLPFSLFSKIFFLNIRLKFRIDCFFKILNPEIFLFFGYKNKVSEKLLGVKFLEKLKEINCRQQRTMNSWYQHI